MCVWRSEGTGAKGPNPDPSPPAAWGTTGAAPVGAEDDELFAECMADVWGGGKYILVCATEDGKELRQEMAKEAVHCRHG